MELYLFPFPCPLQETRRPQLVARGGGRVSGTGEGGGGNYIRY